MALGFNAKLITMVKFRQHQSKSIQHYTRKLKNSLNKLHRDIQLPSDATGFLYTQYSSEKQSGGIRKWSLLLKLSTLTN